MKAKSKWLSVLDVVAIVLFLTAAGMVFFYAPMERVMGLVQKVFYFHVATAWIGMLGFFVAMVAGIIYLATHRTQPDANKWDIVALAGVEIGLVFTLICIVTGSIWARPIWNSWWTWDPRLTTVTIMELAYAAYLMLRGRHRGSRTAGAFWRRLFDCCFHQRAADLLLYSHLAHHPPGGDWQRRPDRQRRF